MYQYHWYWMRYLGHLRKNPDLVTSRENHSLNFIRLLRVVITPSVTSLLRGENDSKQSDELQAKKIISCRCYDDMINLNSLLFLLLTQCSFTFM